MQDFPQFALKVVFLVSPSVARAPMHSGVPNREDFERSDLRLNSVEDKHVSARDGVQMTNLSDD
jgi:hypothetical protein